MRSFHHRLSKYVGLYSEPPFREEATLSRTHFSTAFGCLYLAPSVNCVFFEYFIHIQRRFTLMMVALVSSY
jgi:hypothetical protein